MAEMILSCDWMPLMLKPFLSGLFFPLLILIFLNYNILVGFKGEEDRIANIYIMGLPVIFYALTALRTSGSHSTS